MNPHLKKLLLFNGIFVFAANLLGPLYAVFVTKLNSQVLSVSISWTVFLLSSTFFTYLVAKLGDKYSRSIMLSYSYLIRGIVWFLFIFINSIEVLVVLQVLLGIGEALGTPAFDAIFAEHLDKDKHIADYADWKIVEKIMLAFATAIGGLIVTKFGFNCLFLTMSLITLIPTIKVLRYRSFFN